MLRVNLKSVYSVIHYAVPQMIAQGGGRIVAISSTAGQRGEAFHSHYAASKGAIISFVKGLSTELARHNILVNCVAPGWVDTEMSAPVLKTKSGAKTVTQTIPLKRVATAEEIAGPILVCRIRSGDLHNRGSDQCEWRCGPVRLSARFRALLPVPMALLFCLPLTLAQDAQVLMPDQSEAKAKQLLQQTIAGDGRRRIFECTRHDLHRALSASSAIPARWRDSNTFRITSSRRTCPAQKIFRSGTSLRSTTRTRAGRSTAAAWPKHPQRT